MWRRAQHGGTADRAVPTAAAPPPRCPTGLHLPQGPACGLGIPAGWPGVHQGGCPGGASCPPGRFLTHELLRSRGPQQPGAAVRPGPAGRGAKFPPHEAGTPAARKPDEGGPGGGGGGTRGRSRPPRPRRPLPAHARDARGMCDASPSARVAPGEPWRPCRSLPPPLGQLQLPTRPPCSRPAVGHDQQQLPTHPASLPLPRRVPAACQRSSRRRHATCRRGGRPAPRRAARKRLRLLAPAAAPPACERMASSCGQGLATARRTSGGPVA